jgi:hypothetical protein
VFAAGCCRCFAGLTQSEGPCLKSWTIALVHQLAWSGFVGPVPCLSVQLQWYTCLWRVLLVRGGCASRRSCFWMPSYAHCHQWFGDGAAVVVLVLIYLAKALGRLCVFNGTVDVAVVHALLMAESVSIGGMLCMQLLFAGKRLVCIACVPFFHGFEGPNAGASEPCMLSGMSLQKVCSVGGPAVAWGAFCCGLEQSMGSMARPQSRGRAARTMPACFQTRHASMWPGSCSCRLPGLQGAAPCEQARVMLSQQCLRHCRACS